LSDPKTSTLEALDWPAIQEAVERARRARLDSGLPGATILRIDETPSKPIDWHVSIAATAGRAHTKKSLTHKIQ
jgi:hypothetical protein